jgi:hypothetical protein
MTTQPILLVEDNPDDEALTLRAFAKSTISHEVAVRALGVFWLLLNEPVPGYGPESD